MDKITELTYTKDEIYSMMQSICDEYKIRLRIIDSKKEVEELGWKVNCGCCSVPDYIGISYFTYKRGSLERKLIAFFHEFAHCKLSDQVPFKIPGYSLNHMSQMQYELALSNLGINFAKEKYNIVFSDDAVKWLLKQNMTYSDPEGGESCRFTKGNNKLYSIRHEIIEVEND